MKSTYCIITHSICVLLSCCFYISPFVAEAEVLSFSDSTFTATPNWSTTLSVPQFDPTLGTLLTVTVGFSGYMTGSVYLENLSNLSGTVVDEQLASYLTLNNVDMSSILDIELLHQSSTPLGVFDGNLDFSGISGTSFIGITLSDSVQRGPYSEDNALFTGNGQMTFPVIATDYSWHQGSGNLALVFQNVSSASMTVTYNYNSVPVCVAAGRGVSYENISCSGPTTTVQLDGGFSSDDNQLGLQFTWQTNCPNGTFNNPNSINPILSFDSALNNQSTNCLVTLSVTDSMNQTATCSVPVSVQGCNYDCAGNLNGSAKLDACGVCNGDNQCFNCEDTETEEASFGLDGNSFALFKVLKKSVKFKRKIIANSKYGNDIIATGQSIYQAAWQLAWSLPKVITTCTNSQLCVNVSNEPFEAQFVSSAESLQNIIFSVLSDLKPKDLKQKKYLKKLKKTTKKLVATNKKILATIPDSSQCGFPT